MYSQNVVNCKKDKIVDVKKYWMHKKLHKIRGNCESIQENVAPRIDNYTKKKQDEQLWEVIIVVACVVKSGLKARRVYVAWEDCVLILRSLARKQISRFMRNFHPLRDNCAIQQQRRRALISHSNFVDDATVLLHTHCVTYENENKRA